MATSLEELSASQLDFRIQRKQAELLDLSAQYAAAVSRHGNPHIVQSHEDGRTYYRDFPTKARTPNVREELEGLRRTVVAQMHTLRSMQALALSKRFQ